MFIYEFFPSVCPGHRPLRRQLRKARCGEAMAGCPRKIIFKSWVSLTRSMFVYMKVTRKQGDYLYPMIFSGNHETSPIRELHNLNELWLRRDTKVFMNGPR